MTVLDKAKKNIQWNTQIYKQEQEIEVFILYTHTHTHLRTNALEILSSDGQN